MGKDKKRIHDEDDNDFSRLQHLAKLLRGIKPKQRNHFHERKPRREKSLKDIASEYNAEHKLDDVE